MGGGGVMRAAAKAAFLGSYRSSGSFPEAVASRRIPRPSSVAVADSAPSAAIMSSEVSAIQRTGWETDDWVLAGDKERGELFDAIHPAPRLVFGPVPTLEEAKEATSDLKDALEKAYLPFNAHEESLKSTQDLKSRESSEIVSAVPKHVVQAFSLLQDSPEVQHVVASLASDKNVWDAIMSNEKVMQFYSTHQSPVSPYETEFAEEESAPENVSVEESVESSATPRSETSKSLAFSDLVEDMKVKVKDMKVKVLGMVSHISDLIQSYFGTSTQATDSETNTNFSHPYLGGSIIGLVIAAVLVILCKRGA